MSGTEYQHRTGEPDGFYELCGRCGLTFASHRADSISLDQCPGHEGRMDWPPLDRATHFQPTGTYGRIERERRVSERSENFQTLGDLRAMIGELPDSTPLVIVYDGGVAYSPVRSIEASKADVALVGY